MTTLRFGGLFAFDCGRSSSSQIIIDQGRCDVANLIRTLGLAENYKRNQDNGGTPNGVQEETS